MHSTMLDSVSSLRADYYRQLAELHGWDPDNLSEPEASLLTRSSLPRLRERRKDGRLLFTTSGNCGAISYTVEALVKAGL